MFASILKKIIGTSQTPRPNMNGMPGDKLDDGFLVVGETAMERSTVRASDFIQDSDRPPGYQQQMQIDRLPSYNEYETNRTPIAFNQLVHSSDETESNSPGSKYMSALSDVPFKIADHLNIAVTLTDIDSLLAMKNVNMARYHYDFNLERTLLRDMNNGELSSSIYQENMDLITL